MIHLFSYLFLFILFSFNTGASFEEDTSPPSKPLIEKPVEHLTIIEHEVDQDIRMLGQVEDEIEEEPPLEVKPVKLTDIPFGPMSIVLSYLDEETIEQFMLTGRYGYRAVHDLLICRIRFNRWHEALVADTFIRNILKTALKKAWGSNLFSQDTYTRYHQIRFIYQALENALIYNKVSVANALLKEKFGKRYPFKGKGMEHLSLGTLARKAFEGERPLTTRHYYFSKLEGLSFEKCRRFIIKKAPRQALLEWAGLGDLRAQNILVKHHTSMARFVLVPIEFRDIIEYWASLNWPAAQKQVIKRSPPNFILQKAGLEGIGGEFIGVPWPFAQKTAAVWLLHGGGPYEDTSFEERSELLHILAEAGVPDAQTFISRALYQGGFGFGQMNIRARHQKLERLFIEEHWEPAGPYLYDMWNARKKFGLVLPKKYHHRLARLGVEKAQRKLGSGPKKKAFSRTSDLWDLLDKLS